jgi:hypothetical protein
MRLIELDKGWIAPVDISMGRMVYTFPLSSLITAFQSLFVKDDAIRRELLRLEHPKIIKG